MALEPSMTTTMTTTLKRMTGSGTLTMTMTLGVLPDEPESLPTSGVMTSPNFPADYPNDLHQRKTIQVAEGKVVNIHFTDFDVEHKVDYVQLSDADGTNL